MGDLLKSLKNKWFSNDFDGLGACLLNRKDMEKLTQKRCRVQTFILDRFWVDFGVEDASKMEPEKVSKNIKEKSFSKGGQGSARIGFLQPRRGELAKICG